MSKSVSDSRNAAAIGTRKRTRIAASPGASSIQAARASCGSGRRSAGTLRLRPGEDPAALLEDAVDVRVERLQSRGDRLPAADRGLEVLGQLLRDLLPLRHARQRLDARELDAKRARLLVAGERLGVPRLAARGQVARQLVELPLH